MKKLWLFLLLSLAAKVWAQTNVITPVTVLPTANHSAVGQLRFQDKQSTPHYSGFQSAPSNVSSFVWTLPSYDSAGCFQSNGSAVIFLSACPGGSFSTLGSGTNTTAAMLVGSGASLGTTGTGTIAATSAKFLVDSTGHNLLTAASGSGVDYFQASNGTGSVTLQAVGTSTNVNVFLLPKGTGGLLYLGSSGAYTDSGGNLTVTTCTGCTAGVVAGTDKQVQYNRSGTMSADSNLTWDYLSHIFGITGDISLTGSVTFWSNNTSNVGTNTNAAHYGFFQSALGTQKLQVHDSSAGIGVGGMPTAFWSLTSAATLTSAILYINNNAGSPVEEIHAVDGGLPSLNTYHYNSLLPKYTAGSAGSASLGGSGYRWQKVWSSDADFNGVVSVANLNVTGSCGGCGGPPFSDASALLISGSSGKTATFNLGSLTANQTYNMPDSAGHIPLLETSNTYTASQSFSGGASVTGLISGFSMGLNVNLSASGEAIYVNNSGSGSGIYDTSPNGSIFTGPIQVGSFSSSGAISGNTTLSVALSRFIVGTSGFVTEYYGIATVGLGVPAVSFFTQYTNQHVPASTSVSYYPTWGGSDPPAGLYRVAVTTHVHSGQSAGQSIINVGGTNSSQLDACGNSLTVTYVNTGLSTTCTVYTDGSTFSTYHPVTVTVNGNINFTGTGFDLYVSLERIG